MRKLFFLILGLCYVLNPNNTSAQYYYGTESTIPLAIDSSKVLIKFDSLLSEYEQSLILDSIDEIVSTIDIDYLIDEFTCCSLATRGYTTYLNSLSDIAGIDLAEPFYLLNDSIPFPVGQTFYVAFDVSLSESEIDSINFAFGVSISHKIYGFESVYILANSPSSGMRVLDLANVYHEMEVTHFAHPNFGIPFELFGSYKLYDYYHEYQDHIKKVIGEFNVKTVWDFAGLDDDTVIVAVIDDGAKDHEDLHIYRVLDGYDFTCGVPYGGPDGSAHGMGCAGIIAANHTTDSAYATGYWPHTGVISLNPYSKIMPLRIFIVDLDGHVMGNTQYMVEAFNYACENGAEVASNSWGWCESGCIPVIDSAILNFYNNARGGLGGPVFFAAGNCANPAIGYPACLSYCFAVGATDLDDSLWYYSSFGSHLDVVAPSGDVCLQGDVWTLDDMGDRGWNPYCSVACGGAYSITWNCPSVQNNDRDYNCHFGGTSAACPIVAGVASLLIARNPNLTVDEIYDILRSSAVTDLDWGSIDPPDYEYGYGRVDAFRAMLAICRGDANNDGIVDVGDAVYLTRHIYNFGADPVPDMRTGDANCDSTVSAGDVVYIINYVFKGGPEPGICFKY